MKKLTLICFAIIASEAQGQRFSAAEYIDAYKVISMLEMKNHRIPASITLAQGLLESGFGNSRLAIEGNNHFGIKCKKDWNGCIILEDDDALSECFRCYEKAELSYEDHSSFLLNNKRYQDLFSLPVSDYKAWAKGLMNLGYATNRQYATLIINTIEKYRLGQYDTLILDGFDPKSDVMQSRVTVVDNELPVDIVQSGEDVKKIADEHQMGSWQIRKYNDLKKGERLKPGDIVYLKPKKRKASVQTHKVEPGETMWLISQKYGIRLKHLYKKNNMPYGTEVQTGEILQLVNNREDMPDLDLQDPLKAKKNTETESVNNRQSQDQIETNVVYHIVKASETLYALSKMYSVPVDEIQQLNGISDNQLKTDQVIKIRIVPESGSGPATHKVELSNRKHVVQSKETLYSISKSYGVSIDRIKSFNSLVQDSIQIGQVLLIP